MVTRFPINQFKEHFRMANNCFQLLENKLNLILSKPKMGRLFVSSRMQLFATFGCGDS